MNDLIEVYDKSEESDIIVYKINEGINNYLAEVEISSKKLFTIRDCERFEEDLPDDEILPGEAEYNKIKRILKENQLVK